MKGPAIRTRRRSSSVVLIALLTAASLAVASPAGGSEHNEDNNDIEFVLTVLHNNDGESELLAEAVPGVENGFEKGVAFFDKMVRRAKWRALNQNLGFRARQGMIFVSSGDNFLAGPQFDASLTDGIFYDARALDRLRYSAIDLGNHDFDFGPDLLADFISEGFGSRPGPPPYLSANLDFSGEPALQALVDDGPIAKSTVVRTARERIGIIGATTPNLPFISSPRNVVVDPNVAAVVQTEIDLLEAAGINKIVLVSHLQDIDADIALAGMLSGIDIMVAGGGDELLADPCTDGANNSCDRLLPSDSPDDVFGSYPQIATNLDGNDVPVVTTSGQYGYLGMLIVGFDADGEVMALSDRSGPLRVVSKEVGPDGVSPSDFFQERVVAPVEAHVADLAANIIANSEVDLDGLRSSVRSVESNEGNLIADALKWQAEQLAGAFGVPAPDAALQNGGGIRNDSIIPAGPISELDTFSMVPFPNFVTVFPAIPRSQFKEIMENAVSRAVTGDIPGGTGRFAQISGFSFTWDANGTAQVIDPGTGAITTPGTRVRELVLDDNTVIVTGGAVQAGDDLTVATIDFLARGGDQYPFGTQPFTVLGVSYQQALSNYIQGALGGSITAADYPEGGEGRITRLN